MSYVSKEAAKALKEIGFDKPVNSVYSQGDRDGVVFKKESKNYNKWHPYTSAPNHLEAADWLADNHQIFLTLKRNATTIHDVAIERTNTLSGIDSLHHRDLAILEACKIIKERKTNPLP